MNLTASIWNYWSQGGPIMAPIALVSFGIWFYLLRSRRRLLDATVTPPAFETQIAADLQARPIPAVAAVCRQIPGPIAAAVAHALTATGVQTTGDVLADNARATLAHLGRDIILLTALTAAAPLLGLLGTVAGMIVTFQAVAGVGVDTATRIATGISQALITTQFGLVVAIPGVFGVSRLQRLLDQLDVRFASCRSQVLLALAARQPTPGDAHAPTA